MRRGPVLTLVAVAVLGLVLLGLNVALQPSSPTANTAGAPAASPPSGAPPVAGDPQKVSYVGTVDSDHGSIPMAVTVENGKAKMYMCDGHKIESWMQGTVTGGKVKADGNDGDNASAQVSGGHLTGTMHVGGHDGWKFDMSKSSDRKAGIYRSRRNGKTSGWVVKKPNDQTGLSRDANGSLNPAPWLPLDGSGLPDGVESVGADTDVLAGP